MTVTTGGIAMFYGGGTNNTNGKSIAISSMPKGCKIMVKSNKGWKQIESKNNYSTPKILRFGGK